MAIMRSLTHLSLLLGISVDAESITGMIQPAPVDAGQFLWQHLRADIQTLSRALGRNADECCILLHLLIRLMLEPNNFGPFSFFVSVFLRVFFLLYFAISKSISCTFHLQVSNSICIIGLREIPGKLVLLPTTSTGP